MKELRSKENEAIWQYKYVDELCAELELAVLGGNSHEVKCQRRALTSGLPLAEEAIIRTKAVLEQALDDLEGLVLSRREDADEFLRGEEQRQKRHWKDACQRMAQNTINLASQATRMLIIKDWSLQDCKVLLEDIEKKFRKAKRALIGHLLTTGM